MVSITAAYLPTAKLTSIACCTSEGRFEAATAEAYRRVCWWQTLQGRKAPSRRLKGRIADAIGTYTAMQRAIRSCTEKCGKKPLINNDYIPPFCALSIRSNSLSPKDLRPKSQDASPNTQPVPLSLPSCNDHLNDFMNRVSIRFPLKFSMRCSEHHNTNPTPFTRRHGGGIARVCLSHQV